MGSALKGQVAIITGAGQGVGKAVAELFARQEIIVVVNDINDKNIKKLTKKIIRGKGNALGIRADITSEQDVSNMFKQVLEEFGRIDILVNNAGILYPTKVEDISLEEWDRVIRINLTGTFLCSKAALSVMKKRQYGRIVNFSSSAGKNISTLGGAHYTASKAAVLGFTRHVAKEMAPYGINVNDVCPGLINTEMVRINCSPERLKAYEKSFPISRLGTPEEVAELVLFLVSPSSAYITGASIDINGGDLMI